MTSAPLVLLHGAFQTDAALAPLARALRLRGHRVDAARLYPDDPRADLRYRVQARRLWRRYGAVRPVLIGHSMGAGIVMTCLLDWPVPPRGLVLVGAGLGPASGPNTSTGLLRRGLYPACAPEFLVPMVQGWFARPDDRRIADLAAAALHLGPDRFQATRTALVDGIDRPGRLRPGLCPAVIVHAVHDRNRTVGEARRTARALGGRLVLIPGAGHAVPLEAPRTVAAAIAHLPAHGGAGPPHARCRVGA